MSATTSEGQLQDYSVDQLGGFVVMVAGAIGSLLLVVWQSKCHCKMNLCYIFQCERRPPSEEEMKGLKDQLKKTEKKTDKKENEILEKEKEILEKEEAILEEVIIPNDSPKPNIKLKTTEDLP
tara:strand:+ start:397 stop:765 length:369 start_codon:yes stop_codon:yes gene_type:complete